MSNNKKSATHSAIIFLTLCAGGGEATAEMADLHVKAVSDSLVALRAKRKELVNQGLSPKWVQESIDTHQLVLSSLKILKGMLTARQKMNDHPHSSVWVSKESGGNGEPPQNETDAVGNDYKIEMPSSMPDLLLEQPPRDRLWVICELIDNRAKPIFRAEYASMKKYTEDFAISAIREAMKACKIWLEERGLK